MFLHGHSNHILKMIKKLDANYSKIRVTAKDVNINLILKLYSQAVELEYRSLKKEKVLGLLQSASHNFSKPEDFEKVSSNKFLEQINKELLLSESFSFAFSSISKFAVKIIPKYTSAFNTTELEIFHILYLVCLNFETKSSNRKTHVNNKNLVNQLKLENERLVKFSPFKFKTFNIQIPKKLPENLKIILRALINKPFYSVLEDVEALIKDPSEYKYFYEIFSSVGQHIHNSDLIDFFDISIAELTILERPVSKISKNKLVKTNIKIKFIYQIKQPSVKLESSWY